MLRQPKGEGIPLPGLNIGSRIVSAEIIGRLDKARDVVSCEVNIPEGKAMTFEVRPVNDILTEHTITGFRILNKGRVEITDVELLLQVQRAIIDSCKGKSLEEGKMRKLSLSASGYKTPIQVNFGFGPGGH